jgi:hypothetical protein
MFFNSIIKYFHSLYNMKTFGGWYDLILVKNRGQKSIAHPTKHNKNTASQQQPCRVLAYRLAHR